MKTRFNSLFFVALALSAFTVPTQAGILYWDGTTSTANADGGNGTWDSVLTNWDSLASAGVNTAWPSTGTDNDAVFGGTAGTVTVDAGGVTANDLTFNTANYSIIGGPLTLNGTTPSITNAVAAAISSNLIGSAGLSKIGNGTLTLSGNNTGLSGALTISGATSGNTGGVAVSSTNAFGGFASVDIQNNSFLNLTNTTLASGVSISVAGGGGTSTPQGAIKGSSGTNVINGAVSIADGSVRIGNLGTSLTLNGAITATSGSGRGLLIRIASNEGVIFTNTGNNWEGITGLHDGSHYFLPGTLPSASNLQNAATASTWFESSGSLTRAVGTGANQIQFNATAGRINGFSARGGDLTVNLGGAPAASTLTWGSGGFTPAILGLAGANATGTLTWQNPIDLNAATRTINTANGAADTDAIMSGALSNGTLLATGAGTLKLSNNNSLTTINKGAAGTDTGTLILSGSNTFTNTTLTYGTLDQNRGAIRLEHNSALGGVTVIAGNSGTGAAQARIELANNVTISGTEYRAGGRNNATTSGAAIVNVSGNNTWAGNIGITNTGGSYGIRSDAGKLTISGSLRNGLATTPRTWGLTGAGDFLISGTIVNQGTGTLALNKSGDGTLEITGDLNEYSGGTTVAAGTLLANNTTGSATGAGAVTVNGGTLGGTGFISGAVAINTTGVLSPGASVGTLGTGALSLNTGSTFFYELNTTAVTGDRLDANGALSFDGTVTLSLNDLGSNSLLALGSKFTLISYFGAWDGDTFSGYADDSEFTLLGNEWRINYNDLSAGSVNGGAYTNAVTLTAIPEPGAALLGGLGLLALLRRRR